MGHSLENGRHLIDLIEDNDILLGILLGYGEESSKLYYRKQIESKEDVALDIPYITITSENVNGIEICPVAFKGNAHSKEVKKIYSKFHNEWKLFWEFYLEKNQDSMNFFLEPFCK